MGTSRQSEAVHDLVVELDDETPSPIRDLHDTLENCENRNIMEVFHDAQQSFDTAANAFSSGMGKNPLLQIGIGKEPSRPNLSEELKIIEFCFNFNGRKFWPIGVHDECRKNL